MIGRTTLQERRRNFLSLRDSVELCSTIGAISECNELIATLGNLFPMRTKCERSEHFATNGNLRFPMRSNN